MVVSKIRFDPEERSVFVEVVLDNGSVIQRGWKNLSSDLYMSVAGLHMSFWDALVEGQDYDVVGNEMVVYGNFSVVWGFISGVDMVVIRNE